ncbi:serine hydrolase domain-containing protein [Kitasatospora sp. NPDC059327]|uniref:serine hydrolase domain-containing protein n=1 Tax=Kitasatospora sp. NPDC059327 TaxID=3346803 RepID=UPI003690A658
MVKIRLARSGAVAAAAALLMAGVGAGTAVAAPVPTAPPVPDTTAVRAALQNTLNAGAPGAFAVIRDHGSGELAWSLTLGKADLDGSPMKANRQFRVGSNSKMFASVLVMRLVEQGLIDLDRPLREYLPQGTLPEGWTMTGRQVMQHRAGIYDHTNDLLEQAGEETTSAFEARIRNTVYAPQDLVALSVKHGVQYTPGTKYAYSNTDYVLMGLAIEHLTGRAYGDLLREEIIEPLNLRQTSFVVPEKAIAGPHITGYLTNDDRGKPLLDSTEQTASWLWSAGGVISSAGDMDRFLTALLAGSAGGLVSDDSLKQMTSVLPTPTAKISYGLGVRQIALSCGNVFGHGGIVQGFQTQSFVTPDGRRSVVVFANASNNGAVTTGLMGVLEPAFCGKQPAAAAPRSALTSPAGGAQRDAAGAADRTVPVVEDTRI